jgi:hypothetical protein
MIIANPPEALKHGVNATAFAFLAGKSAHSDIASLLWGAVKDLQGVKIYCADKDNFGYVVVCTNDVAFAFAEGMQGVTVRLPPADIEQLITRGAQARSTIGPEWGFLPLYVDGGFESELRILAHRALAYAEPPSNNSLGDFPSIPGA